MNIRRFWVLLALWLFAGTASATTRVVTDTTTLHAAVALSVSGDVIQLAPSGVDYAFFIDQNPHNFSPAGLTITSQDPTHPASVAGFNFKNWSYFTISNVIVHYAAAQNGGIFLATVDHLTVDHVSLDGQFVGNTNAAAVGLSPSKQGNVSNFVFQNSLIYGGWRTGFGISGHGSPLLNNTGPVLIYNNDIAGILENGLYSTYGDNATVDHNTWHDFRDPNDFTHADAIQFEPTYEVNNDLNNNSATYNLVYDGASSYSQQGVFFNSGAGGPRHINPVQNFNVVCIQGQSNGVFLSYGDNITVNGNYTQGVQGAKVIVQFAAGGTVTNNTGAAFAAGGTGLTQSNNTIIPATSSCTAAFAYAASVGAGAHGQLGPPIEQVSGARGRLKLK